MAREYPSAAISQSPEAVLHRLLKQYGVAPPAIPADPGLIDSSHPFITVESPGASTAIAASVSVTNCRGGMSGVCADGAPASPVSPDRVPLALSSCVSCGACVDTCPTGALEDASADRLGPPATWTRTVCSYCGVGCELEIGVRGRRLVAARPVVAPVNKGHLAPRGATVSSSCTPPTGCCSRRCGAADRGAKPPGTPRSTAAPPNFSGRDQYGPDALGVLGSSRATNEDNYLAQKFARVVLGTNNVDCCARVCHTPSAKALKQMLGAGRRPTASTTSRRRARSWWSAQIRSSVTRSSARGCGSRRSAARPG